MTSLAPPPQHLAPPTPAPSSPAESQLDGGEFFHEKDYQKASETYSSYGGVDVELSEEEHEERYIEGEEVEELTEEGEELAEVWPEPKEDEHAYVAGEGGVRRRRTVHGVMKPNEEDEVANGQAEGTTKRCVIYLHTPRNNLY